MDEKAWRVVLRSMFPLGAQVHSKDELDYSFSMEYQYPTISYQALKVDLVDATQISTTDVAWSLIALPSLLVIQLISSATVV